ncbi:MAG: hypothetical protein JNL47_10885 [Bacteroidia bacterium]|nr:hypothetical protein [Bacteroidia bacterium]
MTEFSTPAKPSFQIWNECSYAVFHTSEKGDIVYANHHALKLFATLGYPAIKNVCQIAVFKPLFQTGLLIHEQEIEWIADKREMKITIIPDVITGYIGFYAEKPIQQKPN